MTETFFSTERKKPTSVRGDSRLTWSWCAQIVGTTRAKNVLEGQNIPTFGPNGGTPSTSSYSQMSEMDSELNTAFLCPPEESEDDDFVSITPENASTPSQL